MPRHARIDAPGALQHIIVRGIERRRLFRDDRDRESLLERLGKVLRETGTPCLAWALMPNHAHFLLKTGGVPLATVMRRLLTGYAGYFNRRHGRHGALFQNRYKSILCQAEPYLLELVRYIHLNPLRGGLVREMEGLDVYPFAGHAVLLGARQHDWQDTETVLSQFGRRLGSSRKAYREFVAAGRGQGRRPELVGGGLIRSLGGWSAVRMLRSTGTRLKGDERILGETPFVLEVLTAHDENINRRKQLKIDDAILDALVERAAKVCGAELGLVLQRTRRPSTAMARCLFTYWAVRKLGITATALAVRLGVTQPAVSIAVRRGERIASERGFTFPEECKYL